MTELTAFEKFTLDNHLSEYPPNVSFGEIMDMIANYDERVVFWIEFDKMEPDYLVDLVDTMRMFLDNLMNCFGKVTIEVSGGVAYATKYPSGMEIHIQDHDNMDVRIINK